MTDEKRIGRQTPTKYYILPFTKTKGEEVMNLYREASIEPEPWQCFLSNVINAVDDNDVYIHAEVGYSVPRRSGKTDVLLPRMLKDALEGKKVLYTAQLVDTSNTTSNRLRNLLVDSGYTEVARIKKDETYENGFIYLKQRGAEKIGIIDEVGNITGFVDFRVRSSMGGLGKGYDTVIIDEAQEYTNDQRTALQYVVTDSKNPQTIYMGTPPTTVSKGTVFLDMRNDTLAGKREYTAWLEWSINEMSDMHNKDLWYETNPALGLHLTERNISVEMKDEVDFNIQRLGLWIQYNQASEITKPMWESLEIDSMPKLKGKVFIGIKFGNKENYVSMGIACKTEDEKIYVEALECRDKKDGVDWIIQYLQKLDYESVVFDGADYQGILEKELEAHDLDECRMLNVSEIIEANSSFENGVFSSGNILHNKQSSLEQVITNCQKRAIGSKGGFGYSCTKQGASITLMDSVIFAYWLALNHEDDEIVQSFSY